MWYEVVGDTVHSAAENFLFCWLEPAVWQGTSRSAKQAVTPWEWFVSLFLHDPEVGGVELGNFPCLNQENK